MLKEIYCLSWVSGLINFDRGYCPDDRLKKIQEDGYPSCLRMLSPFSFLRDFVANTDSNFNYQISTDEKKLAWIVEELLLHASYDRPVGLEKFEEVAMQKLFSTTLAPLQGEQPRN